MGTSLIFEVELSDSSSDEGDEDEIDTIIARFDRKRTNKNKSNVDQDEYAPARRKKLAKEDNVFSKLLRLEGSEHEVYNDKVKLIGKTHF